jgi:hypothetical protein
VADDDQPPVSVGVGREGHAAAAGGEHRGVPARGEVDAAVEAVAARTEAVPHGGVAGTGEAQDGTPRGTPQGSPRGGTGDPVGGQPGPLLEAAQRRGGPWPEAAVDRPRRKAAPGEQELHGGDVPAARPPVDRPRGDARPPATAEGPPRGRADHSVGHQSATALESHHRGACARSPEAVDVTVVVTQRAQGDLQCRHVGATARRRRRGDGESDGAGDRHRRAGGREPLGQGHEAGFPAGPGGPSDRAGSQAVAAASAARPA